MHLRLRIDERAVRQWHVRLAKRLVMRAGGAVSIEWASSSHTLSRNAELLFALESLIYRIPRPGGATLVDKSALDADLAAAPAPSQQSPDLTIDLCGDAPVGPSLWRLTFDDVPGETSLLAAVMEGRAPIAALQGPQGIVALARLGTETPGLALGAFEDGLARVTTLIMAALSSAASTTLPSSEVAPAAVSGPFALSLAQTGQRAGKALARGLVRRLYYLCYHAPHWRVGWRQTHGVDLWDLRRHPETGWTNLPDDGLRFYADPFPIQHKGKVTLFVEEFDHHSQKGILSAVAFDEHRPVGVPQPVLELPYHLSYPFVFEQDGEVWMIPESCAAGTIDLYRATNFPGGWVHEAQLISGVTASDATLLKHGGKWWIFATVRDEGGAYSDTLHLWSAPDFRGPWTPHARNPLLIDIASARPAGRIVERNGALLRPVQDCRAGYGHALGLARILRLDDDGFEQIVETTLYADALWPGRRLHTLNEAGGLEFIDGSAHARRRIFPLGARPDGV